MRFILAIAAFLAAAVLVTFGIAQRTILEGQDSFTSAVGGLADDGAELIVIDGSVLTTYQGMQTLSLDGTGMVFAAYGRTADVKAWVADTPYLDVRLDDEGEDLLATVVTEAPSVPDTGATGETAPGGEATDAPAGDVVDVPSPVGSDLWLNEYTQEDELSASFTLTSDTSVIIAAADDESTLNAVSISWPVDNSMPWAWPMIIAGCVLLLIGLALYLNAFMHLRRTRGPRRRTPKLPKPPKPSQSVRRALPAGSTGTIAPPKGRRRSGGRRRVAQGLGAVLVSTLILTGCSMELRPVANTAAEETQEAETVQATPVAVTVPQLERILARTVTVADQADADRDADLAAERFAGPALALREANYEIRRKSSGRDPLASIPGGTPVFTLPQATSTWPRTVMTVVEEGEGEEIRQVMLVLKQADPRSNYKITYAVDLRHSLPTVASPQVGALGLEPDATLMVLSPREVAAAYGDILVNGEDSEYFALFSDEDDTLRTYIGEDYKAKKRKDIGSDARIRFTNDATLADPIALATTDSGAIVAAYLVEYETVTPRTTGSQVQTSGEASLLLGSRTSGVGIKVSYGAQLLFYVPVAGSDQPITFLGYAQGILDAKEARR